MIKYNLKWFTYTSERAHRLRNIYHGYSNKKSEINSTENCLFHVLTEK